MSSVATSEDAAVGGVPDTPVAMPRGRRRTEVLMLVFAVGIVAFAYANVGFGLKGSLPPGMAEYVLAFAVLVALAHLAVRRFAPWSDPLLLPLAAVLTGLGNVMMYRLAESGRNGNPGVAIATMTSSAATMQVVFTAIGLACFVGVLVLVREARVLQRYTYIFGLAGIVLIALPAVPGIGETVQGAKIEIRLPGTALQPEEFAKLALAVAFAGFLVAKRDVLSLAGRRLVGIDLPRARDLGPVLIIWAVSLLLLVFESDVGTSALFMGLFVAMLYLATQRTSWLLIGFILFVAGAFIAAKLFGHVGERFDVWLHPFAGKNPFNNAFQPDQALYGMGSGGILGKGLGGGQPYITPLAQSDFVISAFGEELGMTGLMAILLFYGLIVQRGLAAALAVKDPFSKLLAGGLSFMLALQVFVIVGGVTRLIPVTGITAPFLAQGGSSLIGSWMLIAMLVRLSDTARRPPPQPIQDEGMTQVVNLS